MSKKVQKTFFLPDPGFQSFNSIVLQERERQRLIGFDKKHDRKAGILHLLNLAYHFVYSDEQVKAGAMIKAVEDVYPRQIHRRWIFLIGFICGMASDALVVWFAVLFLK